MRNKIIILMLGVLLSCGGLAQAVPVTIEIGGEITGGYGTLWGGDIHVGATFTGTYTYDSLTINTSVFGNEGWYVHNSPYGIEVLLGGFEFRTESNHIGQFEVLIVNGGSNWDYYKIISNENVSVNDDAVENISWTLGAPSTISSIALPVLAPKITDWTTNVLEISGQNLFIQGTITHAELIPEPLTGILMAMGVFLLRYKR